MKRRNNEFWALYERVSKKGAWLARNICLGGNKNDN